MALTSGRGGGRDALKYTNSILIVTFMRDKLKVIRITEKTKNKIQKLAKSKNLKEITVLEYLLNGKIELKELWD